jgi:hypothetical protein
MDADAQDAEKICGMSMNDASLIVEEIQFLMLRDGLTLEEATKRWSRFYPGCSMSADQYVAVTRQLNRYKERQKGDSERTGEQ